MLTHTQVLFICTGNSARSILAEALLRDLGRQQGFVAHSAGSQPTGVVNPLALRVLERHGIATEGLRSKSWNEFSSSQAPALNFAFTVCDRAAGETCPIWPGHPTTAHWGIPDPAHVEPIEARRAAFEVAYGQLERRIKAFLAMSLETMTAEEIKVAAKRIHEAAE